MSASSAALDDLLSIEEQALSHIDRQVRSSGVCHGLNGFESDHLHVKAHVLVRLGHFCHGQLAFYESPLGRKTISLQPQIGSEMRAQGEKLGRQIGQDSMREVLAKHPDLAAALEAAGQAPAAIIHRQAKPEL